MNVNLGQTLKLQQKANKNKWSDEIINNDI